MFPGDKKTPSHIIAFAEKLLADVDAVTPDLRKGNVNYDHYQVKSLLEVAYLHSVLTDILNELRFQNHEERMKSLPHSMFSKPGQ